MLRCLFAVEVVSHYHSNSRGMRSSVLVWGKCPGGNISYGVIFGHFWTFIYLYVC